MLREDLRNVAIIAHVDHGKTTLVDGLLEQGGAYHENQATTDRVMDSNALEKERGITILAKNTAIRYGDKKINVIDTPGHADFGGEVERILKMVNGVILLVDAAEGPMPQTRFVLRKAMELNHRIIVVVNKIDRPDARVHEVIDEVLELLIDLNATDEQLDSPMLFCSGRAGTASFSPDVEGTDLKPLLDTIIDYIPEPEGEEDEDLQLLVSAIDYNEYVGKIGIGRIERGTLKVNQEVSVCNYHSEDAPRRAKIVSIYQFEGLSRQPATTATVGDIVCFGKSCYHVGICVGSGNCIHAPHSGDVVKEQAMYAYWAGRRLIEGWSTYNGDHMSMYSVNCGVPKTLIPHCLEAAIDLLSAEADTAAGALSTVLKDICDTPVSPELVPGVQHTETIVGRYELHDCFLWYFMRYGCDRARLAELAALLHGALPEDERTRTLDIFCRRVIAQQFKRSCSPDGPAIGGISLSPRGGWMLPSDATLTL